MMDNVKEVARNHEPTESDHPTRSFTACNCWTVKW